MTNSNMINPANYYNPFAKYNYVSKTRGVYIPKDTAVLSFNDNKNKSTSIYSENYDPNLDLDTAIKSEDKNHIKPEIKNFFKKLFS